MSGQLIPLIYGAAITGLLSTFGWIFVRWFRRGEGEAAYRQAELAAASAFRQELEAHLAKTWGRLEREQSELDECRQRVGEVRSALRQCEAEKARLDAEIGFLNQELEAQR